VRAREWTPPPRRPLARVSDLLLRVQGYAAA